MATCYPTEEVHNVYQSQIKIHIGNNCNNHHCFVGHGYPLYWGYMLITMLRWSAQMKPGGGSILSYQAGKISPCNEGLPMLI